MPHICENASECACGWASMPTTFPPPLAGEGQGEGFETRTAFVSYLRSKKCSQPSFRSPGVRSASRSAFRRHLSLSLPHQKAFTPSATGLMGGGNRGAHTFATHAMCFATHAMCPADGLSRYVHANAAFPASLQQYHRARVSTPPVGLKVAAFGQCFDILSTSGSCGCTGRSLRRLRARDISSPRPRTDSRA